MHLKNEILSVIIGEIYDCAVNPEAWPATLSKVSQAVDAAYCSISLADAAGGMPRMAAHSPWDPEQLRVLNEQYGRDGIPGVMAILQSAEDEPWISSAAVSEEELFGTPFYRDWVKPQGLRDACMVKFVHTAERVGLLGTVTRATRDLITQDEARFVALLSPHFRRAAMIGDLLDYQRVSAELYREVLQDLAVAVVLTDAAGVIAYANAEAERLLSARKFIASSRGRLSLMDPTAASTMAGVLRLTSGGDQIGQQGIGLTISGPELDKAIAYILPLAHARERRSFGAATAAIFISTTNAGNRQTAVPTLSAMFGLTPMEARVMQSIGTGQAPKEGAAQLGITENTFKSHLSRVFDKTGTSRQAELVALYQKLTTPFTSRT